MAFRPAVLLAVLLASAGATGCRVPPPKQEDWLAVGFRTPRQAFRTFQTALAADLPELEYRALSHSFKEREGVTALGYREYREELLRDSPWLRFAATATVRSVEEVAPERVRIVAEVKVWPFVEETFAVDLVPEEFYEYWSGDERLADDWLTIRLAEVVSEEGERRSLVLALPWPEEVDPAEVTEVRAGREWKIDAIGLFEEPNPSP